MRLRNGRLHRRHLPAVSRKPDDFLNCELGHLTMAPEAPNYRRNLTRVQIMTAGHLSNIEGLCRFRPGVSGRERSDRT